MHAIHPSIQHGGAVDRGGNRPQPTPTTTTTTPPAGTTPVTDTISLSPQAKAFLDGGGPGKSANSPAHAARLAIDVNPELANMPFGKIVSGLNHGVDFSAPAPSSTEPVGEAGLAPVGDIAPVDGVDPVEGDPLAVVTGPDAPTTEPVTAPVVEAVVPPNEPVVTPAAIPIVALPPTDLDLLPDVDDVADPEADLLAALGDALDDANRETPDEPVGVDIAA